MTLFLPAQEEGRSLQWGAFDSRRTIRHLRARSIY